MHGKESEMIRSEKHSSNIFDLVQVLIGFSSEKDHSTYALSFIGTVPAMRKRQWVFGKASKSHAPNARLLRSSFSADCHVAIFAAHSQGIYLGNGKVFLLEQAFCFFS